MDLQESGEDDNPEITDDETDVESVESEPEQDKTGDEEDEEEDEILDAEVSNDNKPIPPKLSINIGYGSHWLSEKPRVVMVSTERGAKGNPLVKLAINRDDDSTDKMDSIVLNMTQWKRICQNDPMFERQMQTIRKTGRMSLVDDLYKCLGFGVYEFMDCKSSKKVQIKKKFMPAHLIETTEWNKENCDNVYDYLYNSKMGVSLNAWEYEKLRQYFKSDVMKQYIPDIDSYGTACRCIKFCEERQKRCQFCRYHTFNLEI